MHACTHMRTHARAHTHTHTHTHATDPLPRAVVLGAVWIEHGPPSRSNTRKLEVFHNGCLRAISLVQQRLEHISSIQVAKELGKQDVSSSLVIWLGWMTTYFLRFLLGGCHGVVLLIYLDGEIVRLCIEKHEEVPD